MPSFDPNNFSDGISQAEWKMLSEDDHHPLVSKVTESLYPSGSTIKPSMALALLNAGDQPRASMSIARAAIPSAITSFTAIKHHGAVNMTDAVVKSCDIYFYEMCRRVGADKLAPMIHSRGLWREVRPALHHAALRHRPRPAMAGAEISSRMADLRHDQHVDRPGLRPHQPDAARSDGEPDLDRHAGCFRACSKRKPVQPQPPMEIDEDHLDFIRRAMEGVVDHGTAAGSKLPLDGITMAGKTGTAQVHVSAPMNAVDIRRRYWSLRDHSLFVAFAPADDPHYAAAAIIEHGGFGASVAAPLIRDTLLFLFDKEKALQNLAAFEQGTRRDARRADRPQDRRMAPGKRITAPTRQAGMITSAIIPRPLARLPWRLIFLVAGIAFFGLVVLYSAAGGSAQPWAVKQAIVFVFFLTVAIACRGCAKRRSSRSPSRCTESR